MMQSVPDRDLRPKVWMQSTRIKQILAGLLGLVLAIGLHACGAATSDVPATVFDSASLTISAAASLEDALEEITPVFQKSYDISISYNFASSGSLQRQIEQGAPVDVFFSAGKRQMDALEKQDLLLPDSRQDVVRNQLVLIVPQDSTLNLKQFQDLTKANISRLSVGEFRSVPAGQYAEEVLTKLGILGSLQTKLVFANSVRAVLAAVESGNAEAGIVYATDAKLSKKVRVVAIAPEDSHKPIVYPIATLKRTEYPEAAKRYIQFLSGEAASAIFKSYGFSPVES